MKIIFSQHAKLQIAVRGLTSELVIETVTNPDRVVEQSNGRQCAVKLVVLNTKPYAIVSIYFREKKEITIITAFRTSKTEKYL